MNIQLVRVLSVLLFCSMCVPALGVGPQKKPPAGKNAAKPGMEAKIVDELNLARTKPKEYAKFLEEHRRRFKDETTYVSRNGMNIITTEGRKAVDEAIAFLKNAKPLKEMTLSPELSRAAADHVKDIGPQGLVGHDGTDKSSPQDRMKRYGKVKSTSGENLSFGPDDARDIVMQLIIDDGVASRGHRENIFTPEYRVVGIAVGDHQKYRNMCAMDFADGFTGKK